VSLTTAPESRSAEPVLRAQDLSVHFGPRSALDSVTVEIQPGTITSLLGPNGAGKSTLLKSFAGVIEPTHGTVWYRGDEIRRPVQDVTYIPQRSDADWTFPISVIETVLLGLARRAPRWRPFNHDERQRAWAALDNVGLAPLAEVQIGALSGGQQQRVFLARALVACGDVLLLDEPFTGVDVPTQELFLELFDGLRDRGVTIVYATHDLQQALQSSSRALLLNNSVIADGPPAEVLTDERLTRTFQGRIMVFDAAMAGARDRSGS
jgi:manganese/zinc/iron transport system ATP- binding protein